MHNITKFPGQRKDEHVIAVIGKHWLIDIRLIVGIILLGIGPMAIYFALSGLMWANLSAATGFLISLILTIYLAALMLFIYVEWLNEELDVIIVTDRRILSHEQKDLLNRQVSETGIEQIQDVKGLENGLFSTLFHYGTIEVQTSSAEVFFSIKQARDPHAAARIILDVRDHIKKESQHE